MTTMIETGIPIPKGSGRKEKFGMITALSVGESCFFEGASIMTISNACSARQKKILAAEGAAEKGKRKAKKKLFTCRSMDGGVRVWRNA